MENTSFFYEGVMNIFHSLKIFTNSSICDIGCGTGALLRKIFENGYDNLTGVDISEASVTLTQKRVPGAKVFTHDIEINPLGTKFDLIFLTGVIDFLPNPQQALQNLSNSLKPDGIAIISIRNLQAYWPWFHFRGLAKYIRPARLHHWFLWFTTPLGLRRYDQPFETVFTPKQARKLINGAGLSSSKEMGFQWLPMLWIPGSKRMIKIASALERISQKLPGNTRYYYYIFICRPDANHRLPKFLP